MLILDKADFRTKKMSRDKKWHHIMIKEYILQKNAGILNVYVHNKRVSKHEVKTNRLER